MYGSIPGLSIPSHSNRNRTQAINVSSGYNFKFSSNHILKGRQLLDCYINNTWFSQPVPICTVLWMNPAWQTQRWGVNEICIKRNKTGSAGPQAGASLKAEPTSCDSQCDVMWSVSVSCSVCPALCDSWTVAQQVPLALGLPRQGYPSPGEATQSVLSISSRLARRSKEQDARSIISAMSNTKFI